jgi:hypothetical protein
MDLSLNTKDIDVLARGFKLAEKERPKTIVRAINRSLPKARTLMNRAVREDLALPSAYVQERLKIKNADYKKMAGRVSGVGRPILWGRFKTRASKKGVSARINKKGRRVARGAFLVTLTAGGKAIRTPAVRVGGRYAGTNTLRFKPLYGPSIPQVLRSKLPKIEPEVAAYLQEQLSKNVDRLMSRI